jgi:hypothetical protein
MYQGRLLGLLIEQVTKEEGIGVDDGGATAGKGPVAA